MINFILRIFGYNSNAWIHPNLPNLGTFPNGTIIARNDSLDEIMVEEPDGTCNRYKKVI